MVEFFGIGKSTRTLACEKAEQKKAEGNELFSQGNYNGAIICYTEAIDIIRNEFRVENGLDTESAADHWITPDICNTNLHQYYSNRALCNIKIESYGSALADADVAIMLQPTFSKAFYRRGCANLCLLKFKNAEKDFMAVLGMQNDAMARTKLKQCRLFLRQQMFSDAIKIVAPPPLHETLDIESFNVDKDYNGPIYDPECVDKQQHIKEVIEYIKHPGNVLHKTYVFKILLDVIKILKGYKSVVDLKLAHAQELTICGDIHGQFYDLLNIFEMNQLPSDSNPYLFNGDFVDRGSFSVECCVVLFLCKALYPNHFHIVRGNHETESLNRCYGFKGEVLSKYDETAYNLFCEVFCHLPLGYVINDRVLVLHGGLFGSDNVTLEQLRNIERIREPPESGLMTDMLWSDPKPFNGKTPSKRGVAYEFGPDVTHQFLQANGLELLIRSHEMKPEGYDIEHDGKVVTIFSAPNYCDQMGNKGAFIRLNGKDCQPKFTTFEAVAHPPVKAMHYANPLFAGIY
ncbi:bifunctional Serine-threonine-specific protein phosphatase-bis(5-nucleosyl)-tetraphosphatase/Metallo-dependent phosphatase-like/Tetratricopeptide-like helical domain superfamily/Calcineurin-like phosphoesterase domain [Babesia duncani]|uniref:Serine/threonine-protein phosphatase n=1 Tax=Babesia duncani TaxID=323732 RepID=A0AAD9PMZ1_9APIC|nr:bifunctional Serine-threonine-specific protein phosphatase-bis(5-nucleosyl)-tetraphosphatase/Metallo-dependent phosphatase-like/Tetratricopeptide-like helical domain superfamily/Calcineurin-like phosphoesterase domain [Babesia duncani]